MPLNSTNIPRMAMSEAVHFSHYQVCGERVFAVENSIYCREVSDSYGGRGDWIRTSDLLLPKPRIFDLSYRLNTNRHNFHESFHERN